ncbi:MAG: ATPase, partial [Erythrobacter sp.]
VLEERIAAYRGEVEDSQRQATGALTEHVEMLHAETKAIAANLRQAETDAMAQLEASKNRFYEEVMSTVESLDKLDKEAIDASQRRVKELHEEAMTFDDRLAERDRRFIAEMGRRQEEFDQREAHASDVLAERLAALDDAIAQRREAQLADTERLVEQSTAMTGQLDRLHGLIGEISEAGDATRETLTGGLDDLGRNLDERREALAQTKAQLAELTENGVRLLEIIQSGAHHSREDLAQAVGQVSGELTNVEERAENLSGLMFQTRDQAEGLGNYLIETNRRMDETGASIDELEAKLSRRTEDTLARLNGLRGGFAQLADDGEAFSDATQEQMRDALDALQEAIRTAFTAIDEGAREKIGALASSVTREAIADIERTLRDESAASIEQLETAAAQASGAGRDATAQLRDQLAKVNELTANLEQRVADAREKAQEQVNNDFARRMALITDNLNSNAIDIASALSAEVTDTAWDSYLKGDRGIFTRRAVRLIDNGSARSIADLYQRDDGFKRAVNRFIHDFEAMLRSMLSTRDGNALAITILGSDSGKLYVVLAQALERIRT